MELPLEKDAHVVSQEEELKDLYLYSLKAGSHRIQYLHHRISILHRDTQAEVTVVT